MKRYVSSDKTAKIGITYKRLQKRVSSFRRARNRRQKVGPEQSTRIQPVSRHTAEPIDMVADAFLKYIFVYNYTRTQNKNSRSCRKQKKDTFLLQRCHIHV